MNRTFLIIGLLLSLALLTGASRRREMMPRNSISCTTANDSELVNHLSGASKLGASGTTWRSQQFAIAGGATITGFFVNIEDTSSDVGNVVASLYTDDGALNKPASEIANTTVTVALNTVPGTETSVFFTLPQTFSAVATTKYHIVVRGSASGTVNIYYDAASLYADGTATVSVDSGSTWDTGYTTFDYTFSIWGCTP